MLRGLCLLFFLLSVFAAKTQPVALRSETAPVTLTAGQVQWLIDTGAVRSPNQLDSTSLRALDRYPIPFHAPSATVWMRFDIQNRTGRDGEYVLRVPKTGQAALYLGNAQQPLVSGSLLPLDQRSVISSQTAFRFWLRQGEAQRVWLRLNPVFSIYVPRTYPLTITPAFIHEHNDNRRLLWQGIFLGVILIMALYNGFIGVAVKDLSYFWYVLSILGIGSYFAFYYGFGIEYLWPQAPVWDTFCYLMIVPFNILTRLLFTRTYLHTRSVLPGINRIINILIGLNLAILITGFFAYQTQTDIIAPLLDVIALANTFVHLLMLGAGLMAYYRARYQPAKFFIWANIVLAIGAVLFIGRELSVLPDNFATRYLVQIGFLIQVIVFSLGLASRLNSMRAALARETLEKERLALEKEREKKELLEEQRQELIRQVAQQTADLKQKNIELERSFSLVKESEFKQTQLNQIKDKLFSVISHDLRNPLATMQSFLKLITEHHDKLSEEEKDQLFVQAQQSLDHLNELMFNLLQWSRSQMNLLEFRQEKFAVKPVLENAARLLQLNAHMKNIGIRIDAEGELFGFADKSMTEFIVRNLLSNAIKFSHRNHEVEVLARKKEQQVLIEVRDRGIGLSESRVRKLLEMNSTASRRGTEKEKGTGLGLLISKEFIEKNRGRLTITSDVGKGSTFAFTIQATA